MKRDARRGISSWMAVLALVVAACGGGGGSGGGGNEPTATATPVPSHTPGAGMVAGLVVLRGDVGSITDDAVGAPPAEWNEQKDAASFDRALSHADWTVDGEAVANGVTGPDGSFQIDGLAPGRHVLWLTRTLDGNLVTAQAPFAVGPDGSAEVIAEVSWGSVRATSVYSDGNAVVREIFGANATSAVLRDGTVIRLEGPGMLLVDADGDGQFDGAPCDEQLWDCSGDRACGEDRICQCTASCPTCEDCGPPVCTLPAAPPPYRCGPEGSCAQPGDRCVCVSSCPECDDCSRSVCIAPCGPVEIREIILQGPTQLIAGQSGWISATAHLSNGLIADVTQLVEWHSSVPEVATVDSWGYLAALGTGTTDISASLGAVAGAPWRLNVNPRPPLTRIHVQNVSCYYPLGKPVPSEGPAADLPMPPETGDILPAPRCQQVVRVGGTVQFAAIAEFGDGLYYEDVTQSAQWQVTPSEVGGVTAGLFTGLAEGTAQVTASLDDVTSDPTEVRVVTQPTLVYLSVYAMNWAYPAMDGGPVVPGSDVACWECGWFFTLLRGDEVRFGATAQYDTGEWEDVTNRVTWRSSDPSVAPIDSTGLMAAAAAGEAQIDATLEGMTSNAVDVRVVDEATLQGIYVYPEGTDRVVARGAQLFFRATGQYDVGLSRDVTQEAIWHSGDENVGGFDEPGVFSGRAAGTVEVWAELDGLKSDHYTIEVYATGELDYCDPDQINRDVWSDAFNRVVLESDCASYPIPGLVTLRYTVTETQPHGGIFDPCLDLYVFRDGQHVRTLREEGCGEPFLPSGAPEYDAALIKYQLRAFWDLKDDNGNAVSPGTYTIYGRFFLYYDPVVSVDVTVGDGSGTPLPTRARFTPTPTPIRPEMVHVFVGSASAEPGEAAEINVTLRSGRQSVAGVQNDISVPAGLLKPGARPDCQVNPEINKSGTAFSFLPAGCDAGTDCTQIRALVLSIDNVDPIPDGAVLYTCRFQIPADWPLGGFPLLCSNASASSATGQAFAASCEGGVLSVGPTPTPTATEVPAPVCTPPPCAPDEVFYCPGYCPGGCGTMCVNPTPTRPPGETDLSGAWTITVIELGLTCPAHVQQDGTSLTVAIECAALEGKLSGALDSNDAFHATGSVDPLCPTTTLSGRVLADGNAIEGSLACETFLAAFRGVRGDAVGTPTPTPAPTPIPPGTPPDFDLSGAWMITVPEIGYVCPAEIQQSGSSLAVHADCAGLSVDAEGNINQFGDFSLTGLFPPLCPTLTILGAATSDASRATGRVLCDGVNFSFEARRDLQCSAPRCQPGYVPACAMGDCADGCGLVCAPSSVPTPGTCGPPSPDWFACNADDDCVLVDAIGCCPCSMGGRQAAVNHTHLGDLADSRSQCCDQIACLAVFLCEPDLKAVCQNGTCQAQRPTP